MSISQPSLKLVADRIWLISCEFGTKHLWPGDRREWCSLRKRRSDSAVVFRRFLAAEDSLLALTSKPWWIFAYRAFFHLNSSRSCSIYSDGCFFFSVLIWRAIAFLYYTPYAIAVLHANAYYNRNMCNGPTMNIQYSWHRPRNWHFSFSMLYWFDDQNRLLMLWMASEWRWWWISMNLNFLFNFCSTVFHLINPHTAQLRIYLAGQSIFSPQCGSVSLTILIHLAAISSM